MENFVCVFVGVNVCKLSSANFCYYFCEFSPSGFYESCYNFGHRNLLSLSLHIKFKSHENGRQARTLQWICTSSCNLVSMLNYHMKDFTIFSFSPTTNNDFEETIPTKGKIIVSSLSEWGDNNKKLKILLYSIRSCRRLSLYKVYYRFSCFPKMCWLMNFILYLFNHLRQQHSFYWNFVKCSMSIDEV